MAPRSKKAEADAKREEAKGLRYYEQIEKEARRKFEEFKKEFREAEAPLKYDAKKYNASRLMMGSLSESEMRGEYQRLRRVAQKRIARLTQAGYYKREAVTEPFLPLSELPEGDLYLELSRVAKFVQSPSSSVRYWRVRHNYEKAVAQRTSAERDERSAYADWLREHARKMEDVDYFTAQGLFFGWVKEHLDAHRYDSEILRVMFKDLRARHISWEELLGTSVLTRTYQRMSAEHQQDFRNALFSEFYSMYIPDERTNIMPVEFLGPTADFASYKKEIEAIKGRRLVTVSSYSKHKNDYDWTTGGFGSG